MTDDLALARLDAAIERAEAAGHHETAAEWRGERAKLSRPPKEMADGNPPILYRGRWVTWAEEQDLRAKGEWKPEPVDFSKERWVTLTVSSATAPTTPWKRITIPDGAALKWPDAVTLPEEDGA